MAVRWLAFSVANHQASHRSPAVAPYIIKPLRNFAPLLPPLPQQLGGRSRVPLTPLSPSLLPSLCLSLSARPPTCCPPACCLPTHRSETPADACSTAFLWNNVRVHYRAHLSYPSPSVLVDRHCVQAAGLGSRPARTWQRPINRAVCLDRPTARSIRAPCSSSKRAPVLGA